MIDDMFDHDSADTALKRLAGAQTESSRRHSIVGSSMQNKTTFAINSPTVKTTKTTKTSKTTKTTTTTTTAARPSSSKKSQNKKAATTTAAFIKQQRKQQKQTLPQELPQELPKELPQPTQPTLPSNHHIPPPEETPPPQEKPTPPSQPSQPEQKQQPAPAAPAAAPAAPPAPAAPAPAAQQRPEPVVCLSPQQPEVVALHANEIFNLLDEDNSGEVEKNEFKHMIKKNEQLAQVFFKYSGYAKLEHGKWSDLATGRGWKFIFNSIDTSQHDGGVDDRAKRVLTVREIIDWCNKTGAILEPVE